jgi:DNA-binding response OmpR family regulator
MPRHDVFKHHGLELDPVKHMVKKDGREVRVARLDFALLEFFMRHPGETFGADTLVRRVWQSNRVISGEAVRMAISRLRKSIDDPSRNPEISMIEYVPRLGYRLR